MKHIADLDLMLLRHGWQVADHPKTVQLSADRMARTKEAATSKLVSIIGGMANRVKKSALPLQAAHRVTE